MEPGAGADELTVTFESCLFQTGKQRRVRVFQTVQFLRLRDDLVLEDQLSPDEDLVLDLAEDGNSNNHRN